MATATQLAPPRAVFTDANGAPLAGGFVHAYVAGGGTTLKTTWQDAAETIPNANPIVLDAAGSCLLYGAGSYTLAVTDASGNAVAAYSGTTQQFSTTIVSDALVPVVTAVTTAAALTVLDGVDLVNLASKTNASLGSTLVGYFRSATAWVGRTLSARLADQVSVMDFGADSTGVADCTAAIQAGINYTSIAGGTLLFPPGTYKVTGTLTVIAGSVVLQGASEYGTILSFANGTADCIKVGFQVATTQGVMIRDMSLVGSSKTAGWAINASVFKNAVFSNLSIRSMANGITVDQLNNVALSNIEILLTVAGTAGVQWTSPASALGRSDVLTLRDVVVNGFAHGAIGLLVDGMCQTLRVDNCGFIACGYGMVVRNTAASASFFPEFIYCNDLEIDGVDHNAILISGGREMHFVHADCFNSGGAGADTDCLSITADSAASITNLLTFTGCRFGGAQKRGVYCEAKEVNFLGCYVGDNSLAGSGLWPAIQFGNNGLANGAAIGGTVVGGLTQAFGDFAYQSYGVAVASGCAHITITGVDFSSCVTGAVLDSTGVPGNVIWHGCYDINGAPYPDRVQVVSVDPAAPYEGMMWENITTHSLKVYLNGAVKTVTVV